MADVYVHFVRSLDGKSVRADSLMVECPALGIRMVTRDSVFQLMRTVDVRSDDATASPVRLCDLFTIDGALRAEGVRVPSHVGTQWSSQQYGNVLVVDVNTCAPSKFKSKSTSAGEITDLLMVRLTAWRQGYAPAVVYAYLDDADTTLPMVFDLLPWWQRIAGVQLLITDSLTYDDQIRSWSHCGGGGSYKHDTSKKNINVYAGGSGKSGSPPLWTITDTNLQYAYYQYSEPYRYEGWQEVGVMTLDESKTRITWLSIQNHRPPTRWDQEDWGATVTDLPPFDAVSSSIMTIHCNGQVANKCLVGAGGHTYHDSLQSQYFTDATEDKFTCLHTDRGIYITCIVRLRE